MVKSHGLRGCRARKKPLLQKRHLKTRLKFAADHMDEDKTFWRKVLGSDKTKIELFGHNTQQYVWRRKGEAFKSVSEKSVCSQSSHCDPEPKLASDIQSCRGTSGDESTDWSDVVVLTLYELSVSPSWLSPGASVTLSCQVEPSPSGTRFFWYKAVPDPPRRSYSYELLPGSSDGTDENFYIVHGLNNTAGYVCEAGRGKPNYRDPSFVFSAGQAQIFAQVNMQRTGSITASNNGCHQSGEETDSLHIGSQVDLAFDLHVRMRNELLLRLNFFAAVLSFQANCDPSTQWSVVYSGEKVTLRCKIKEGGRTQWTYEWRTNNGNIQIRSSEYSINEVSEYHSGVYRCMAAGDHQQTEWSDGVTLTVKSYKPRATLTADPTFIPAGGSTTLTCSVDESDDWKFDWFRNDQQYSAARGNRDPNRVIYVSEGGEYSCRGGRKYSSFQTEKSDKISVVKIVSKPTVILQPSGSVVYRGEKVTLRCEIKEGGTQWTYEWRKNNGDIQIRSSEYSINEVSEYHSGVYSCMAAGDHQQTEWSDDVTLTVKLSKPTVNRQPSGSVVYRGEKVTLRCEIKEGGGTQWTYEWSPDNRNSPTSNEYSINSVSESDSGSYYCMASKGDQNSGWSFHFPLTVKSPKPQPVLSVSPSWPNPGASVTLSCEGLELQSAGWRFFWYKAVPDLSKLNQPSYTYDSTWHSINGTEQNSFIINGPTQTSRISVQSRRGEPKFYTRYSEIKFIWSAGQSAAASLTVSPDRVQHFWSESVTLTCKGNSTDWRVRRFTETGRLSDFTCSTWGTMTGSTCTINKYWSDSGVYWCESGSGEFSNAVNITVHGYYYDDIILVSPVHPVTEGNPVTLSCRNKQQFLSNVFFYHNDKLINNDSREELNISAVSKSDEGFYKCKHSEKESPGAGVSVSSRGSSTFPDKLIVGLVVGIVLIILIILLLLLWCCRRSKDSWCISSNQSNRNDVINQTGSHGYNTLRLGDVGIYGSVTSQGAAGDGDTHFYESVQYPKVEDKVLIFKDLMM
ncbi:LOW QUALITY PROTEIN: uncharacterized protein LOC129352347 [Poeciliopsis prolifica]|uniref:LOW QUALITY PROTEIN: uncharacterized protein LOC129352347 n=1 Tax=Poeciliopsis prolifica TaxID=188132 RepID=UPI00241431E8|nr:LOW QUALITY PROTEIN: uncharacterized protein LOC129352347 [Poeciliopsis prolifica]